MGLISDDVEVRVEGLPHFSHKRTSISFLSSVLLITKLSSGPGAPAGQVDSNGAHFKIQFPAGIVFQCLERSKSFFRFEGPFLGTMDGRANRPAAEDGPSSHAISQFTLELSVTPAENLFALEILGTLSPMRQLYDHWPVPPTLSTFGIRAPLPLDQIATMFSPNTEGVRQRIEGALKRLKENRGH